MADVKISQLTALASASSDVAADVLAIVDTSVPQTKKITIENLVAPLTLDKTNSIVGIGASSPSSYDSYYNNLVVSENGNAGIAIIASTSGESSLGFGDGTGAATYRGAVAYVHTSGDHQDKMFFKTAATNQMVIDSSGNLGLGAISPSSYNSNADNLVIHETGDFTGITLSADNDQGSNIYFADPDDDNVGGITYNHTSNYMNFRINGSEKMRISSDGKVGIGTTPAGELHLHSGDNAVSYGLILENNRDANNNQFIEFRNSRLAVGDDETEGGDWLGEIMWKGYANSGHHVGSRIYSYATNDWTSSAYRSAMVFQTTSGTSVANQMLISPDGEITQPNNPAFCVILADDNDKGTGTTYELGVTSERFDRGGNFSGSRFTAPVDGVYQLNLVIRLTDIPSNADFIIIAIVTSNENYTQMINPTTAKTHECVSISVLADMDENDVAYVTFYQQGGSGQTNIDSESHFSGYLVG